MGDTVKADYEPRSLVEKLGYLIEEAGEVQKAAGKLLRFGPESFDPRLLVTERVTNRDSLLNECRDMRRAIAWFERWCGVHRDGSDLPIPMVLHCSACRAQHVDADEWATLEKAHRTHLCAFCGALFRPSHVSTVGVRELPRLEPSP